MKEKYRTVWKIPFVLSAKSVLFFVIMVVCHTNAQKKYTADWTSLDTREVAPWFADAKFGIFIHWGLYSVPAWSPKGTYAEWYQHWIEDKDLFGNGDFEGDEVWRYHEATYGKDFSYYDFGPLFKADLFQPAAWAQLFKKAGAKYVVLTSKHHDGYALWPSAEANDRGFPWNSMVLGPKRDLVGELSKEVKGYGLKMGLYYSFYEWYHPLWIKEEDRPRYVTEHMQPQIRDLVESYQPDILWPDGEWEMTAEQWQSKEFLAWLFNESPVKETVVVNDRWGKGIRQQHGGYFTTEYEAEKTDLGKPWEECRGMGFSFGYNQNEDVSDYNSTHALVLMLINIVASGGNLLLDVGPDARGNIPVVMQDRLLAMGQWLAQNGEAIYGTRTWKRAFQWSREGVQNYESDQSYLGGDFILKQTVDPEPGHAVKELFFTQNNSHYFAIAPQWPGTQVTVRDFSPNPKAKVGLLGSTVVLPWQQKGEDMVIDLSGVATTEVLRLDSNAYVFAIEK